MSNSININGLCQKLLGQDLGTNEHGQAGRRLENLVENWGLPVNRGVGCDIEILGLELKSRDLDATSAQNVATMTPRQVVDTDYEDSVVFEKFQQQLRVFTRKHIVVAADIYDFSQEGIQDLIKNAYETGRGKIAQHWHIDPEQMPAYVYGSEYGYWERIGGGRSYTFRINPGAYDTLERMAKSTFANLFEYA